MQDKKNETKVETNKIGTKIGTKIETKIEAKRLLIYLALSFGLSWIIFFAYMFSGEKWDGSNIYMEQFISLGMLVPFIAHILTRMITKEGFAMTGKNSLMLGISFQDKKWKYYIFALFVPWIYFEMMHLLALVLVPKCFDTGILPEEGFDNRLAFVLPLLAIFSAVTASFAALGEEGGWRGYMMPKLMKLMNTPKALILGGVIWGIWHAPLTCCGHNFGTDYPGFPYVGILIMCVFSTLLGIMLTYITMKTESIWPAAFMHAVNNANPSILKFFVNTQIFGEKYPGPIVSYLMLLVPMACIDGIIILKEIKKKAKA